MSPAPSDITATGLSISFTRATTASHNCGFSTSDLYGLVIFSNSASEVTPSIGNSRAG